MCWNLKVLLWNQWVINSYENTMLGYGVKYI